MSERVDVQEMRSEAQAMRRPGAWADHAATPDQIDALLDVAEAASALVAQADWVDVGPGAVNEWERLQQALARLHAVERAA